MLPLRVRRVAAAFTLATLILACGLSSRPDDPTPPTDPSPAPGPPRELQPLAAALTGGTEFPLLGQQLLVDVPADADAPTSVDFENGVAGSINEQIVGLYATGGVQLEPRDLPCIVGDDLEGEARAEFSRQHPEITRAITLRSVATRDETLRVVELVPSTPFQAGNYQMLAIFVIDVGGHAIWIEARRWDLAPGFDTPADDDAARLRAESVMATLRRGPWSFDAPAGERGRTDLFEEITVPEGWVLSVSNCCNEEPPYMSHYVETVAPLRAMGASPRAEVTARNGTCPAGEGSVPGTMFGEAIRWSRTPDGLCWQQHAVDDDEPLGVAWDLRGDTDADRNEAITVAATAR